MNKVRFYPFFLLLAIHLSCDGLNIFNSDSKNGGPDGTPTDSTLLFVQVSGGIAGVNQLFYVHESGLAIFQDTPGHGGSHTGQLSPADLDTLLQVMQENDFFELDSDSSYIDYRVADAFFYSISYTEEGRTHDVYTDHFGAPENLQRIVDYIVRLMEKTRSNNLELALELSNAEIRKGESVEMTLTVTNTGRAPITLRFSDGQIFDFKAILALSAGPTDVLVWNWAYGMAFVQVFQEIVLDPGEAKSYTVTWDGTNNDGEQLTGYFNISASLVSVPGGSTSVKTFHIAN